MMPKTITTHLKPGYGMRLKESRDGAGLSQRALAFPGCTAAYISRLEKEDRNPSMQMVYELARRLVVDPHWLATGERLEETNHQIATSGIVTSLREQLRACQERERVLELKLQEIARIVGE